MCDNYLGYIRKFAMDKGETSKSDKFAKLRELQLRRASIKHFNIKSYLLNTNYCYLKFFISVKVFL